MTEVEQPLALFRVLQDICFGSLTHQQLCGDNISEQKLARSSRLWLV